MRTRLVVLSCCMAMAAMLAYAQDADYQMARVVAFERVPADVQHPEKADTYKISMRLGDTIYNCHANAPVAVFNDWTTGKEFPAKVNGKTLLVKNTDGQIIEMKILGKKTAK